MILTMTMKDKQRANVISAIMDGKVEVKDAGRILGRSVRQMRLPLKIVYLIV